jgi:hypothetical protein
MADIKPFNPSPYGVFDASQWSNPYSRYSHQALPWPPQYVGMPTNAMGQPIQPPPGVSLSTPPAAPAPAPAAQSTPVLPGNPAVAAGNMAAQWGGLNSMIPTGAGQYRAGPGTPGMTAQNPLGVWAGMGGGQSAAPAAQPTSSGGQPLMDYNTVLGMLANPGKVTTPGAQPGAAPPNQPGPGVLQQFLANWNPAQSGPGAGFQQSFASTLKQLGY